MAARCASCSYPLSVSDSVSCCECLSYFHIDCAQLVGFPYYELSSDPIRNTFHCQTCKILPLPRQSDGFSDSDSDDECAMPSRQLDYHLEGQPEFATDMNEVKGTVQDLSDLCKDMFREINELKSINLTLRCCVENLRHDGEKRDGIILELKRRLEALEGNGIRNVFKPINTSDMYVDRISIEEDAERYLTPDPEYSRLKEIEDLERGSFSCDEIPTSDLIQNVDQSNVESETVGKDKITEKQSQPELEPFESPVEIPELEDNQSVQTELEEDDDNQNIEKKVHFAEEETMSTTIGGENTEEGAVASMKDWGWRGNEAIQLKDNKNDSSADEEEDSEASSNENTEAQGWEILDEDVKSETITKHNNDEASESDRSVEESEDEVEKYDKHGETIESNDKVEESITNPDDERMTEVFQAIIERRATIEAEESDDTNEAAVERAERASLEEEEVVEKLKLEGDVETIEGSAEVEDYIKAIYTGRTSSEEGSRLESDLAAEEGAVPREPREGGQSPEDQGEVQPSEFTESSEPPPPPQPQHTPDDLWDYLKETVSGEHPSTVEEFVQKLIGTLEHVPEEYLKPVIDFNIKRTTSPSVTDEDHLYNKDHDNLSGGDDQGMELTGSGEDRPQENEEVTLEGDHTTFAREGEPLAIEEDAFPSEESPALPETTKYIPEDPSESAEGYSALEARA